MIIISSLYETIANRVVLVLVNVCRGGAGGVVNPGSCGGYVQHAYCYGGVDLMRLSYCYGSFTTDYATQTLLQDVLRVVYDCFTVQNSITKYKYFLSKSIFYIQNKYIDIYRFCLHSIYFILFLILLAFLKIL